MLPSASRAGAAGPYSPSKRTGLVFSGTGSDGVYHAGVLRALQEAGVKIDVVAGHGVGAAAAMLAAIDGGAKLWDDGGLWSSPRPRRFYRWRLPLRLAGLLVVLLAGVFAVPALVLTASAALYAVGFGLTLLGLGAGSDLVAWVAARTTELFAGAALPTVVPRAVMLVVLAIGLVLIGGFLTGGGRDVSRRLRRGGWWRVLSSPLDTAPLRAAVSRCLWELVRGAATSSEPSNVALSRRYVDALADNLGQPGCRELLVGMTDLDARRDVVGAVLSPAFRQRFFASQSGRERGAETVDLTASGRDLVVDMLGAALTPSIGADAHRVTYPTDGYWAGETHRACDRPGIVMRLLSELDAAQVVQVIVVSAAAPPVPPHRLRPPSFEPRARLGEFFSAAEAAALDDSVDAARALFDALFVIRPVHNPVGPFDLDGTYDLDSDRRHALAELQLQGYHDAYRQFIEPVVGASGEQLATATT